MNAAGVTPTTAVSGAAAATTKKTIWGTPSASLRRAPIGMSVDISAGISYSIRNRLDGRPAGDVASRLPLQELTMLEVAVEGAILDHHVAALDRHRRPRCHHLPLPRRVVGLVQVGGLDRLLEAGLDVHGVGVGAHRQRPLPGIKSHDLGAVGRDHVDEM